MVVVVGGEGGGGGGGERGRGRGGGGPILIFMHVCVCRVPQGMRESLEESRGGCSASSLELWKDEKRGGDGGGCEAGEGGR